MKYVLVDKGDNIVSTIDLASNVGLTGAKTYFKGVKRIDGKSFDKLWKVMTKPDYDRKLEVGSRKPSSHRQIEWWKEDKDIVDDELKV